MSFKVVTVCLSLILSLSCFASEKCSAYLGSDVTSKSAHDADFVVSAILDGDFKLLEEALIKSNDLKAFYSLELIISNPLELAYKAENPAIF